MILLFRHIHRPFQFFAIVVLLFLFCTESSAQKLSKPFQSSKPHGTKQSQNQSRGSAPPNIQNWDIIHYDNFDGTSLDSDKWTAVLEGTPTNNSLQAYLPEQVAVSGGNLIITSNNQPALGLPYRSGLVSSNFSQRLGRFEVRARLPTSKGMWPAIWLLPDVDQYPWPSQGEIDLMENRGDEPFTTSSAFHWGTNPPFSHSFVFNEQSTINGQGLTNFHDDFHVYAVEWEDDRIRYYVDGVHHFSVSNENTDNFLAGQTAPMRLILNTAVGGDFLDNPDGTTQWPQQFQIDYAYVYERADGPFIQSFANGSFEENGGGMSGWTPFGNSLPNCITNDDAASDGSESLKLYGQFNGAVNYSGVAQGMTVVAGDVLKASLDVLVPSNDSIAGTNNSLDFKIDYYSKRDADFGSSFYLGSTTINVANHSTSNDVWQSHTIDAVAPATTVEARVALVFIQPSNQSGAIFADNVTFEIVPEATNPFGRKLLDGDAVAGQLSDVLDSDNIYYKLDPAPTNNALKQKVDIILLGESSVTNPSSFSLRLEAAMIGGPTGDVIQTIQLWNEQNQIWEDVDTRPIANSEVVVDAEAVGDLTRFVHPTTGEVVARLIWASPAFAGSTFDWMIDLDQAVWLISD